MLYEGADIIAGPLCVMKYDPSAPDFYFGINAHCMVGKEWQEYAPLQPGDFVLIYRTNPDRIDDPKKIVTEPLIFKGCKTADHYMAAEHTCHELFYSSPATLQMMLENNKQIVFCGTLGVDYLCADDEVPEKNKHITEEQWMSFFRKGYHAVVMHPTPTFD